MTSWGSIFLFGLKISECAKLELKNREYQGFINSRKNNIEVLNNMEKVDSKILDKYYFLFQEGAGSEVEYLRQKISDYFL